MEVSFKLILVGGLALLAFVVICLVIISEWHPLSHRMLGF